ncbi:ATP-binding protein [Kineococcus auxinigenes]|uniref:ATP-binding protein n=1 Tax=unclassified Kineococcus TaxID=2621656 RepID=UPI003D7E8E07
MLEFKRDNADGEAIGEYISALSNSAALAEVDRAHVVWGVDDATRDVVGTSFSPEGARRGGEELGNWLTRQLQPQVHFTFQEIDHPGGRVVVLEIERARSAPVQFKGVEYVRDGSYKKKLKDRPLLAQRLWRVLGGDFSDEVVSSGLKQNEVLEHLDRATYYRLLKQLEPSGGGALDDFSTEGFVAHSDGKGWSLKAGGAALFGKDLRAWPSLRRKAVRVVQYRGRSRVETVRERSFEGGYAVIFESLLDHVADLLPRNEVIGRALRAEVPLIPELALREVIANALVHQDFRISGAGPLVEIFDDRVEVTNPGVPLVDPVRFVDTPPRSRNEFLAAMMRRVGVCEERGSGWDKVAFQVELHQLPAPSVEVTEGQTRVVLFGHRPFASMDREERVRAVYLHTCLKWVMRERANNESVRERFGILEHNKAMASRLLKMAVDDGVIRVQDESVGPRSRRYVPFWASMERVGLVDA